MFVEKSADGAVLTSGQKFATGFAFLIAVVILAALLLAELPFMTMMVTSKPEFWGDELKNHAHAIVGLQVAGAVAFALAVFLRQTDGPVKFKALGFEFDGASGQVVMWVVCFLAIATAIKMCW